MARPRNHFWRNKTKYPQDVPTGQLEVALGDSNIKIVDLQFMTKWYAQSIKDGVLDFDAYDTYYKEKKSKKKKQTKRRRVN